MASEFGGNLTNEELRAAPVEITGSFSSNGLTDAQLRAAPVPVSIPGSVPVTGAFFQATQPVSAAALPLPSGASTEATLALIKAKTDNLDVLLSTRTKPADTQPVSAAALPLPAGAATSAAQGTGNASVASIDSKTPALGQQLATASQPVVLTAAQLVTLTPPAAITGFALEAGHAASIDTKTPTLVAGRQPVDIAPSAAPAATLGVTATGVSGAAVTLTLPAVAAQFHYITLIEITKHNAAAITASGTPMVVTSTNLPGSLAWTMGNGEGGVAIGASSRLVHMPASPLKSSVLNTATTIVCPATTGIIWRVNVYYQAAL